MIHLEHQAQAEDEFSLRMFRYFARLYEKHRLPVYPIVLFSYAALVRDEPEEHRVVFPDLVVLDFTYRVIQLGALSIAQLDQLGEALLDFSTLADLTAWFEQHAKMEDAP